MRVAQRRARVNRPRMNSVDSSKSLDGISREVYLSAFQSRPGLIGDAFRAFRELAGSALALAVFVAPLALLSWPASAFVDSPAKLRSAMTIFFGVLFALCIAFHCLELLMAVPWKDRRYPVLLARSQVAWLLASSGHGFSLSATSGIYGALLWVAWWRGWQASSGDRNTLVYAAMNTALAGAMFLYGRFQPCGAFRAPTPRDRQWLTSESPATLVAGKTVARAAPPAEKPISQSEYATPVSTRAARLSFADIFGMQEVKDRLLEPARAIVTPRAGGMDAPANGILLHGSPGNGKTIFAEALAGELQVPIVTLTYGDVASKWLGEMPRLVANCFAYAKANAPCVFFIDEIDSFLRSRELGSTNSEDLKIVNTLLTEIVAIRAHQVVLVGATNHLSALDSAATREGRFDLKVEITAPDEPARIGILRSSVAKYAQGLGVDANALLSVARRWHGFSVSRLVAICKALPDCARKEGFDVVGFDQWLAALRLVQGSKARPPAGSRRLAELVLGRATRQALESAAHRLRDVERLEALGGTIPSGILLHGAPGTGKTAAACALAVECGWAFLPIAGPDLLCDRDRLNRLYAEAMDLRPALIFIDEADEVLANRQFGRAPELVSRLLTMMNGALRKVNDVVFIAATNHPDQIDPALLRSGRFTEKIEFAVPPDAQVPRFIQAWLDVRRARLERGFDADSIALMIGSQTIADVQGVLQYALNCAIQRGSGRRMGALTRTDICAALKVVCGIESFVVAVDEDT